VTSVRRTFIAVGNRIGVWTYRASGGRFPGGSNDVHVLVITAPGRRTGIPRSTCVRYLDIAEGFVVWGTASGARSDPDWFRNLRRTALAGVQIGSRRLECRPRELLGLERDRVWNDVVVARVPAVAKLARRAGRTIPVAVLEPVGS
jgi:deazaflavin-dependent oxidoreductase (nitroreductase family)